MDGKDRDILRILQDDARTTQAEIGRRIGLSAAAVNERIRRLEEEGLILKWTVRVDDLRAGLDITAFVEVFVERPEHEREFVKLVSAMEEVLECHFVTGDFSCLLKVKVANCRKLRELVLDRINALGGVRQTRTYIVLDTVKEEAAIPIPEIEEPPARRRK